MNVATPVLLGTPAIGAVVFGIAGAAMVAPWAPGGWVATTAGAMALIGWGAGHGALQGLVNPGARFERETRRFEAEMARRPKQSVVFNIPHSDGYVSRVVGGIPLEDWQAVAKIVVEWRSVNLSLPVVAKALPSLVQSEQRAIHNQMTGLLSDTLVGVLMLKGKAFEITFPVGRNFFKRVSDGRVSPLQIFRPNHRPLSPDVSRGSGLQPTHTYATDDFGAG